MGEGAVLALVRHSVPQIDPNRPAREWPLSAEGCRRSIQLADCLAPYGLDMLVTSTEPKAVQTAAIAGEQLDLPVVVTPGLHEHDRGGVSGLDRRAFEDMVRRTFRHPDERVFGAESAHEARERFARALDRVLARHDGASLGVVSHGTVLALYVAEREGEDAYALWQQLGLPCVFVLARPELRLIEWWPEVPGERSKACIAGAGREGTSFH